ncbi:hypothetical protein [Pseudorhodoferax sp.]|uniref:hypothetical protein n=1 Tax=Pseudorhodoferax sp. TaxID=1993553 RepID=UPI002DD6325C|nr:hypothetical protein [Pseudorhodoferax sp.]
MDALAQALRGAQAAVSPPLCALETALVAGAGGTLGSAVLTQALVAGRFQQVAALVRGPLASTVRGLRPLPAETLQDAACTDLACTLAFVVFERERHSNGRDDAFFQPEPVALRPLAEALHRRGVRRLVVVVPHAPALLPHALKGGFASAEEGAVAALGFEHLVFVRAAQAARCGTAGSRLQRFADWWLSQLGWMVPQREQPVRAVQLATLVVHLARTLAAAPPGTRVLPPELLWQASQAAEPEPLLQAWLGGVSADQAT